MLSKQKDKKERGAATPNATEETSAKAEDSAIKEPQKAGVDALKAEPGGNRESPETEPLATAPAIMVPPETNAAKVEPEAVAEMETRTAQEPEPIVIAKDVPKEELDRILRHHVWGAMGIGLIPAPLLDFVGITGVQINLLRRLTVAYDIPFFKGKATKAIASLAASALPVITAPPISSSLIKAVPFLGQTIGVMTMPIFSGAATYALGKVFIQHFASGGTFLTFDPNAVKTYYVEMLKEGQQVVAELK